MGAHSQKAVDLSAVQAPSFAGQRKLALIVAVAGLAGALIYTTIAGDWRRFQFSWLFACIYFMTLGFGGLFFVLLHHVTRAGWSTVVRRVAEHVMTVLPVVGLLLAPLVVMALMGNNQLYQWVDISNLSETQFAGTEGLFEHKQGYLNAPFFLVRYLVYIAIWVGLVRYFRKRSLAQDVDGDPMHSVYLTRRAAPAIFLFALSLTFAAIDFVMSLDAPWFSTIFGVYIFAGSFVSFMSLLALLSQRTESQGPFKGLITPEHYHDIGKLMFAFIFFWSYIAFSQFILIWYADIPEETLFYEHRIHGAWKGVSLVLLCGHIFIPFLGLLSRHVKRNRFGLRFWAIWILIIHAVDLYWLIMPVFDHHHVPVPISELLCLVGVGGVAAYVFLTAAANKNLTPVKDPRLPESLAFQNV